MALTPEEANSFIEKIGQVFDVAIFTGAAANRVLSLAKESVEWEGAAKEELTKAGLPQSSDQIQRLPCNLGAPFPADFFVLEEVKALRPEYLAGTWFNRQDRPFKVSMELDWVNRLAGTKCYITAEPMIFGSTGDHIWNFISEIHIHPEARKEFARPRDGWIEAPDADNKLWNFLPDDSPLNFIERLIQATGGGRSIVLLAGMGGWATFERGRNSDITAAAAGLLFKFSDPLYCARSDGKVVIKLKDVVSRATMKDKSKFPSRRTLVTDKNKFPSCIP